MSLRGDELARLHRLAFADIRFGVEQHRGGDDRRRLVDAELLQRRVRRRLHLLLREAAVIFRAGRGKSPCPPHLSGSTAKWPSASICVPCWPGSSVATSSVLKAWRVPGMPTVGLALCLCGHRKRRLRHGVGAQIRQLVGFRLRIGEQWRATLPGRGAERVRHADLVALRPGRAGLEVGRRFAPSAGRRRRHRSKTRAKRGAVHRVLPRAPPPPTWQL